MLSHFQPRTLSPAWKIAISLLFLIAIASLAIGQPDVPPPPGPPVAGQAEAAPQPDPEGLETLTRGPIHEAFANPAELDPAAAPTVAKQPPPDVPEQPPAYKPEGDYIWIPGYWIWDEDRDDFLWVTGVWRQPPPSKHWVPGYWQQADGGWQRVQGFWMNDEVQEVAYYDQPPATLETGPSSPAPADNYFWVPGNWAYANTGANTGFNWQAGYWTPYQQNWVYAPARWLWSPAGYVFVPGYWDYRLTNRGQIFAPVYFQTALYTQPGYFYQPSLVIPTNNLFIHLWVRPRIGAYYFGNYFAPQYAGLGFVPWVNISVYGRQRYYYDPFYAYARVHYQRQGVDFLGRVQGWHNYYAQNPAHRPPVTWREQQRFVASHGAATAGANTNLLAEPIQVAARQNNGPLRLAKIDERARESQVKNIQQIKEMNVERRRLEHEHIAHIPPPNAGEAARSGGFQPPNTGEKGKAGPLLDRADGRAGETTVHAKPPTKLTFPKPDRALAAATARPSNGDQKAAAGQNNVPPPLPGAARTSIAAQDKAGKAGGAPRPNALPDGARSTFAPKAGQSAKTPGRPDDPRTTQRETGRNAKVEPPANVLPPQPRGGANPGNPGALPRRTGGEGPRGGQPAIDHELPQVHPPGPAGELPRVGTPGRPNELPRTGQPGRSGEVPRGPQERGKGNPGFTPGGGQPTFGGARGRGQGGDQPTFGGAPARGQGGQQPGGQPRSGGQQDSGKGQPSSNKGKSRSNDKG